MTKTLPSTKQWSQAQRRTTSMLLTQCGFCLITHYAGEMRETLPKFARFSVKIPEDKNMMKNVTNVKQKPKNDSKNKQRKKTKIENKENIL